MVERFLSDPDWARWANTEIARRCGVDQSFVWKVRQDPSFDNQKMEERLVTRNGTTYTMNVVAAVGFVLGNNRAVWCYLSTAGT